ncbi:beat protein-like protein [Leptotrombidium deliense]|uniref:Beat protein-like protein n=1 Tax=Leptotrombidium deliense TaxID=299467 RepID=A0A443S284_9ACAR|nr:beat protein-like protein [Leptotrombidium deliense]
MLINFIVYNLIHVIATVNVEHKIKTVLLIMHKIEVPEKAIVGQSYQFKYVFDLEGHELHSVRWYKNESEFLRFEPNRTPKFKI